MADKVVQRQIEAIADEAQGSRVSVLVQMQTSFGIKDYVQAAAAMMEARQAVTSARAFVPPARSKLRLTPAGRITAAGKRSLAQSGSSSAPLFLATDRLQPAMTADLRAKGLAALQPILSSKWVRKACHGAPAAHGRRGRSVPTHFPLSGSAVLDLTVDQLCELPDQVEGIADVFPNRIVRVPPVAKAEELPPVVVDSKVNTWGLAKTGALAAWGVFGARGKGARVAILDTGVDAAHPDLAGKVAGFAEFDDRGEVVTKKLADAYDSDQHGTHCAGIVAGGNASGRWIGMAPEAELLCGLVLKDGGGTDAQILAGIEWAIASGAHVISMSLGGLRMTADVLDTYTRAIINANRVGIPVVVAIGNEGSQTSGSPGNDYFAFTVGATDHEDWAAGFSGGRTQVIERSRYIQAKDLPLVYSKPEVSAPGVAIYSSVPKKKWEAWNGTSMATPHVAGAMAQILGATQILQEPATQRVNLLQSLLVSTVKELGEAGQNHRFGHGRIDVLRALGYAKELGYL
ncbi:MAG: S8 family serine peptidase [Burkholderiales bacterium]|nr:S8 family serine peptidase [Burkholderiales bacterium]